VLNPQKILKYSTINSQIIPGLILIYIVEISLLIDFSTERAAGYLSQGIMTPIPHALYPPVDGQKTAACGIEPDGLC
jgi:hypothetical protein